MIWMTAGSMALAFAALFLFVKARLSYKELEKQVNYVAEQLDELAECEAYSLVRIPSEHPSVRVLCNGANHVLEKAYERQSECNRTRQTLLQMQTNISHDLRTPVTVLKGYTELLKMRCRTDGFGTEQEAVLKKLSEKAEELSCTIDDYFSMAKIQSGDMVFKPESFNLTQACREIMLDYYNLLEQKGFEVEMKIEDKPVRLCIDADAFCRILRNLIDNAVKYGGEGKFLGIALTETEENIKISVEDHGQGMTAKEQEKIFARTYSGERNKAAGNGLGLAIAQELTLAMGGEITVESRPYKRTVFTVAFPP